MLSILTHEETENKYPSISLERVSKLFHNNNEASSETSTLTCGSDVFWFDKYRSKNLVPYRPTRGSYTPKKGTTSWAGRPARKIARRPPLSIVQRYCVQAFLQNMAAEVKERSPQPRLVGVMLSVESSPGITGSTHRGSHNQFLCQNKVLIICMTQDQLFHTYG
jgi:hypothetical protein